MSAYDDEADAYGEPLIGVPPFAPIGLTAYVHRDDRRRLKGQYPAPRHARKDCSSWAKPAKNRSFSCPSARRSIDCPGIASASPSGTRTAPTEGPRSLEVTIARPFAYQARFRDHVVALLEEGLPLRPAAEYRLPFGLVVLACLPLSMIVLGGMVGGLLGGTAFGLSLLLAGRENVPIAVRALASVGLGLAAVGVYFLIGQTIFG